MKFGGRRSALAPDPDLIRSLAKLLDETGLTEIECSSGDQRIRVSRQVIAPATAVGVQSPAAEKPPAPTPGTNGADHPGTNGHDHPGTLKAPLVGIAYLAAEPGQPPYVRVGETVAEGQTVTAGQTLLLIEAMKTFNQLKSPLAGTIIRILVEAGAPVEYGEPLLVIA